MWSAPGIHQDPTRNHPPMGLGMNAEKMQLGPPFRSFCSEMSAAREKSPDGQPMNEDEEDPELARKRKELKEIQEQIILKKVALYLKQGSAFVNDTPPGGVRDQPVARNAPDTSAEVHAFPKLLNEDGERGFFCHKGASLRDRVKSVLQQKHTVNYFTKMQLKTTKETMKPSSLSKDGFLQEDHPLRRRVHALMRQKFSHASAVPATQEVAGIKQAPPSQSLPSPVQESILINKGFQRFLSVLNQGVDIHLLSKIINDDTEDLPARDQHPPAAEMKSDLSKTSRWSEKPPSHGGAQLQDHRQTNSGESKTDLAGREQSNKKGMSKADDKKDRGGHLGSSSQSQSSPANKKGLSKVDEKDRGRLGSSTQSQSSPTNNIALSEADEKKDRRSSFSSRSPLRSSPSSNKGIFKADEKDREGRFGSSSQSPSSPSYNKGIFKADEKKDRRGRLSSRSRSPSSPSYNKGIFKADEKKDRRGRLSSRSRSPSSPSSNKGIFKADEKKDREGRFGSSSRSRSSPKVERLEKVDAQQEQLQNILKTLGLNLEPEEMSGLTDRTQERLYGKKADDKQTVNSRQQQEYKQRSPQRRRGSSSSSSSSDIYRGLSANSSDSMDESEQRQSSDSSSSRDTPTFQENKQAQQGGVTDKDGLGFKEVSHHQPYSGSQIFSFPLSHVLANYNMAHYAQHSYLSGTYSRDLNLAYTQDALTSWYYLNGYHYPHNHNSASFRASSAGNYKSSDFDTNMSFNPDLSISEGQTGMSSGPRYIQIINTQPSGEQRCLTQLTKAHKRKGKPETRKRKQDIRNKVLKEKIRRQEKSLKECKTSNSNIEVSQSADKMVSESQKFEVKQQPTGPQQEVKWQPTGPQQEVKWQPTGPQQEVKQQPTGPQHEVKRQSTGPKQEVKQQTTQEEVKQQREAEIKAKLNEKLEAFNLMVKQRFTIPARNPPT